MNATAVPNWNTSTEPTKEITPDEAIAGAMEGEQVVFSCCPKCSATLAVYIRQDKPHVAVGPIAAVKTNPAA